MSLKKLYAAIFLLLFSTYFLTARGYLQVNDTAYSFRTAKSLVTRGTLAIEGTDGETGPPGSGTQIITSKESRISNLGYSKYGIGLPVLFVPAVTLAVFLDKTCAIPAYQSGAFLISFYNCFFGACTGLLFFRVLLLFSAPPKKAFLSVLALCFGTVFWVYSLWDFSEVTQSFFFLLAIYYFVRRDKNDILIGSIAYFFLIIIKITYLIYIPLFVVYLFRANPISIRRCSVFLFFTLSALLLLLALNYLRWGNPIYFGYNYGDLSFSSGTILNFIRQTISVDYGLFLYSPILIMCVMGYYFFIRDHLPESFLFLSIIITNIFFHSGLTYWNGEWAYGARYVVPTIPIIALPLFSLLNNSSVKRVFTALLILSCFFQIGAVLTKSQEYDDIRFNLVPAKYKDRMPGDLTGAFVILKHRLIKNDNIYTLREFGVKSDIVIDTSAHRSYRGLNLWWAHLARTSKRPIFYAAPLLGFFLITVLFFAILKELKKSEECLL